MNAHNANLHSSEAAEKATYTAEKTPACRFERSINDVATIFRPASMFKFQQKNDEIYFEHRYSNKM